MTAFNETPSGSLSFSAALAMALRRQLSGAVSFSGSLSRVLSAQRTQYAASLGLDGDLDILFRHSEASGVFERATASGVASSGTAASGSPTFEDMAAAGYGPLSTDIAFAAMTATGTAVAGSVALGAASFRAANISAASIGGSMSTGASSFQAALGSAVSLPTAIITGAPSFQRAYATARALVGGAAAGSSTFKQLEALAAAHQIALASGVSSFELLQPRGIAAAALSETFSTWVLNPEGSALTEYQNYDFNSFADFGGHQYGAGPGGIMRLDGDDDAGANIDWVVRTGFIDGKEPALKRLDEVLFSMRFDGPIRVRVWTDDDTMYEYSLPNYRPDVIHQVRTRLGKGLKSRFFRIELAGLSNTYMELHSMNLPFAKTTRRVG